jgi:PQQ-like domain
MDRSSWRALLLCVLVLGAAGCWPQSGGNAANQYHNPIETVLTTESVGTLAERWSVPGTLNAVWGRHVLGGESGGTGSPGEGFARVRSLDADTGAVNWSTSLAPAGISRGMGGAPTVVGGDQVWAGWQAETTTPSGTSCSSGSVRLDLETGAILSSTPGPSLAAVRPFGDPVATNHNTITTTCVLGTEHVTRVLDGDSGAERWRGAGIPSAVVGDRVVTHSGTTLRSFDSAGCGAADCSPVWTRELSPIGTVAGGPGDRLYVVTLNLPASSEVLALDGVDGSEDWRIQVSGFPRHTVDGDRLFIATGNMLSAYTDGDCGPLTCTPSWTATLPNSVSGSLVNAGGVVYVPTADGAVTAYASAGCGAPACDQIGQVTVNGRPDWVIVAGGQLFVQTAPDASTPSTITAFAPS